MRSFLIITLLLLISLFATRLLAETTQPSEITKTVTAAPSVERWGGWAGSSKSIPGWGNVAPEPGTVTVFSAAAGPHRTFSGKVDGLDSSTGAEVGVVSLSYTYWVHDDTYHWTPLATDGTFSISDDQKYPNENKCVILRAPGHPWTYLSYIFKEREGGRDIVLHAEPGKAVRVTMEVAGKPLRHFWLGLFAFNKSWVHSNNPLGYQWGSNVWTPENSDGNLTVYLPLHPIALYVFADGGANHWEIVDARGFDHLHFILLPAARFNLTVVQSQPKQEDSGPLPLANAGVLIGNEKSALSNRSGVTDKTGHWSAGGLPPGRWWLDIGKSTVEFDIKLGQTLNATFDTATAKLKAE